jgi:hypothetical protein
MPSEVLSAKFAKSMAPDSERFKLRALIQPPTICLQPHRKKECDRLIGQFMAPAEKRKFELRTPRSQGASEIKVGQVSKLKEHQ